MCGIFGLMTSTAERNADDFLAQAFTASMLRGTDSSGIVNIDPGRDSYYMHKLPICGSFFATDRLTKRIMGYGTSAKQISLAHVRAATVGEISVSNAHPFEVERDEFSLVGVHNGTLTNWQSKKNGRSYDVDSEWAMNRIADEGTDAFKDFSGAYAMVWWDSRERNSLKMARNKERPMALAFLKSGGMAWASEAGMLYWLLERNSIDMDGQVWFLDEGKEYTFPIDSAKEFTKKDLPSPPTYTAYTGRYSHTHTYTTSIVDEVKKLIKEVAEQEAKEEEVVEPSFPQAFESEIAAAKSYGWYDADGEFIPQGVNEQGDTYGIFECMSTDFDAIVRGDWTGIYSNDDIWKCRVLGLIDEGKDLTLVLSRPSKTLTPMEVLDKES